MTDCVNSMYTAQSSIWDILLGSVFGGTVWKFSEDDNLLLCW